MRIWQLEALQNIYYSDSDSLFNSIKLVIIPYRDKPCETKKRSKLINLVKADSINKVDDNFELFLFLCLLFVVAIDVFVNRNSNGSVNDIGHFRNWILSCLRSHLLRIRYPNWCVINCSIFLFLVDSMLCVHAFFFLSLQYSHRNVCVLANRYVRVSARYWVVFDSLA